MGAVQNVVPVVATNMEGNLGRIRTAIVAGTAIPLVMFLLWNAVILGTMPQDAALEGAAGAAAGLDGVPLVDPIARLQELGGTVGVSSSKTLSPCAWSACWCAAGVPGSCRRNCVSQCPLEALPRHWSSCLAAPPPVHAPVAGLCDAPRAGGSQGTVQVFSFFAIATSYIGFVLGLTDFLSDCKTPPTVVPVTGWQTPCQPVMPLTARRSNAILSCLVPLIWPSHSSPCRVIL